MTHSDIADLLDQTPDDIEAYEEGTRRITASCLVQLTKKLDLSLPMFFLDMDVQINEGLPQVMARVVAMPPSVAEGLHLMKLFHSIKDPVKRASVLAYISDVAATVH
jgi:hypothetical protein